MADLPDTPKPESGNGKYGFLTRKIGPLPVWAWAAIAIAVYYWYTHYGPGKNSTAANAANTGVSRGTFTETITRKLPGGRPPRKPPHHNGGGNGGIPWGEGPGDNPSPDQPDTSESPADEISGGTDTQPRRPPHRRHNHRHVPSGTHYTGNGTEQTRVVGRWQHPDTANTKRHGNVIDVIGHRPLGV